MIGRSQHRVGAQRNLAAVLFDWDDTLVDSFPARLATLRRVLAGVGITHPTAEEVFRRLQGGSLENALDQLEAALGKRLGLYQDYRRIYWTEQSCKVRFFPGVEPVLRALHERGIKLGVVTQKYRAFQIDGCEAGVATEIRALGVNGLFSAVVGYEDVARPKPDPEAVQKGLVLLGCAPDSALVVGDSAADIAAGKAAGCWTCLALWASTVYGTTSEATRPDLVAHRLADLLTLHCAG